MGKNTSILLGDYFENYVNEKVRTGKYTSVSEIVRTALRLLETEENKSKILINELKIGEKSGMIKNFDRNENLKKLHAQHLNK
ncbi:MAG: type II toxin-antitoxin system ParD family antitoxin [Paludibacteraceae bacterium]|jgi:antitoxin ParD1/3/4